MKRELKESDVTFVKEVFPTVVIVGGFILVYSSGWWYSFIESVLEIDLLRPKFIISSLLVITIIIMIKKGVIKNIIRKVISKKDTT